MKGHIVHRRLRVTGNSRLGSAAIRLTRNDRKEVDEVGEEKHIHIANAKDQEIAFTKIRKLKLKRRIVKTKITIR